MAGNNVRVGGVRFDIAGDSRSFVSATNRANRAIARHQRRLNHLSRTFRGLTGTAVGFLGAYAGVSQAFAAVNSLTRYETALQNIVGLVGIAQQEVNGFNREVIAIARETGLSANDLADALFAVTSSGARGAVAVNILRESARAAAGGLVDTTSTARAATAAVNAYGAANLDAATAVGTITAAVRAGNLEAQTFAPVIGRIIPVASVLGVEFQEAAAAIAFFTRQGADAAEAVTGLTGILKAFVRPSVQTRDALEEVGLSMKALRIVLREQGLLAALDELHRAFNFDNEQLSRAFRDFTGVSAVFQVLGENRDAFEEILGDLARSSAAITTEAFEAQTFTIQRQFSRLVENVRGSWLELTTDATGASSAIAHAIAALNTNLVAVGATILKIFGGYAVLAVARYTAAVVAAIRTHKTFQAAVLAFLITFNAGAHFATAALAVRAFGRALAVASIAVVKSPLLFAIGALALFWQETDLATNSVRQFDNAVEEQNARLRTLKETLRLAEQQLESFRRKQQDAQKRGFFSRLFSGGGDSEGVGLAESRALENAVKIAREELQRLQTEIAQAQAQADKLQTDQQNRRAADAASRAKRAQQQLDALAAGERAREAARKAQEIADARVARRQETQSAVIARMVERNLEELQKYDAVILEVEHAFDRFTGAVIENFENIGDAAKALGRQIISSLIRQLAIAPLTDFLGGALREFVGGFGGGGGGAPIPSGLQTAAVGGYRGSGLTLVGERGPELIDFTRPGRVYTNQELTSALAARGGGGASVTLNFAPTISSNDAAAVRQTLIDFLPQFRALATDTIRKQLGRRTGTRQAVQNAN